MKTTWQRGLLKNVTALLLAIALLFGAGLAGLIPTAEAAGPPYYYSIHIYDWEGDASQQPEIHYYNGWATHGARYSLAFSPYAKGAWRVARFSSNDAKLDLYLKWAGADRTAYGWNIQTNPCGRFVLTPEYPNVYIFAGGPSGPDECTYSTVYVTPNENGSAVVSVVSYPDQNLAIAGERIGWDPIPLSGTALDAALIPDGDTAGTRQLFSYTMSNVGSAGVYPDEFKILRQKQEPEAPWRWYPDGMKNAATIAIPGMAIQGPAAFGRVGSHQFTVSSIRPNGAEESVTATWSVKAPVPAGVSINSATGLLTTTSATPEGPVTLIATIGGTPYERTFYYMGENAYLLKLHYYQYVENGRNYNDWNVWIWGQTPAAPSGAYYFDNGNTPNSEGWVTLTAAFSGSLYDELGIIVRKGDWVERSNTKNMYLSLSQTPVNSNGETEVWFLDGENVLYTSKPSTACKLTAAVADAPRSVIASLNFLPSGLNLTQFSLYDVTDGADTQISTLRAVSGKTITMATTADLAPNRLYEVRYSLNAQGSCYVTMRNILGGTAYRVTDTDLGLTWSAGSSQFKVWAPTAAKVELAIYNSLNQWPGIKSSTPGDYEGLSKVFRVKPEKLSAPDNTYAMTRSSNGLWSYTLTGNHAGKFYMFKVTHADGTVDYAIDPYVKATSANGQMGAIIDTTATGTAKGLAAGSYTTNSNTDHVLYELHVRDFTIHPSSGISDANKGKYLGFTERGTTVNGVPGAPATGLDHLIELGVTTVHLLPIYDYGSVNELAANNYDDANAFNWGYDPQNYNTPEGSYSSDATNPSARIAELKALVSALHDAGIRVVMDVVYNHTFSIEDGPFDKMVPGYYYRTWPAGNFSDGSGCGNEVASERYMVRKYIIDSLLYWQSEFGFDGFRFDLMALIDEQTMYDAVAALKVKDPNVIIYGEPWAADSTPLKDHPTAKETLRGSQMNRGFAYFNDDTREKIKGGNDDASKGFVTGAADRWLGIAAAVKAEGWHGTSFNHVANASETISYAGAHDNLVLWDKVQFAHGTNIDAPGYKTAPHGGSFFAQAKASSMLANGIVLTTQGIPFFHAGDEILRSKRGNHNSYNASDFVNAIVWEQKETYADVFAYYQGLIQLRKTHPAFRQNVNPTTVTSLVNVYEETGATLHLFAYRLNGALAGDSWNNIYVAYNGGGAPQSMNFGNTTTLNIVVNATQAGTAKLGEIAAGASYTLPGYSMVVAYDTGITPAAPYVTVTSSGLDNLKVGQPVTGSVVYTLHDDTYKASITSANFNVSGLPAGLTAGAAVRTSDTVVTVPITGTPTTTNTNTVKLTLPSMIPVANLSAAVANAPVSGGVVVGPVSAATVITSAAVNVVAPMTGETPNTTATPAAGSNFTAGPVTWSPSGSPFAGNTVYTATVTLTANTGYTFTGLIAANINGRTTSLSGNTGTTVTLSCAFAATPAKAITGIAVLTQPAKLAYAAGETLNLTGLSVELTYSDSTKETVAPANFAAMNISASPANGTVLTVTQNGTPVTVSVGSRSATTSNLAVGKGAGAAATAPTQVNKTETTVTVTATLPGATGQTIEYARSATPTAPATGWQDSGLFTGLTADTEYYFFARSKENVSYNTGAPSAGTKIRTDGGGGVTYLWGDADDNGVVNAADAAAILRLLVQLRDDLPPKGMIQAKVTGAANLSAADAARILRFLVSLVDDLTPPNLT
ncbi:MAG: type I pullulanase [Clostridiales bacterium]|nr:type I pullulanase [Clostridiales bacterium]